MRTLITLFVFVALLISGCVADLDEKRETLPAETTSDSVVEVSPLPEKTLTPEISPAAEGSSAPTEEQAPAPEESAEPVPYDYTMPVPESAAVEDAWFADAVLIGDSRTDGMRLYSGMKGVDFLCYKGLSVFEVIRDKQVIQTADGGTGVLQALGEKAYAKVYVSLGINELGYNDDEGYADAYSAIVDKIKELQPGADIYLQLLIPVNEQKCSEKNQPTYITNRQIDIYNDIIRAIAAEKQVYLLNPGEIFVDETGQLQYDASFDGVHFNRAGYQSWYEYLKTHTVEEGVR